MTITIFQITSVGLTKDYGSGRESFECGLTAFGIPPLFG